MARVSAPAYSGVLAITPRSFVVCGCAGNDQGGHIRIRCLADGCSSVWYEPPHRPGAEVTGQPGGAAMP
jgi:hypothetical protein